MAKNKSLSKNEMEELIFCRLVAIEQVLSEVVAGFNKDMESLAIASLDATLTATEITNITNEIKANKSKYKAK
jgi:hypothetical protein